MSINRLAILLFVLACVACGGGSKSQTSTTSVEYPTNLRVAKNAAKASRGQTDAALKYADAFIKTWNDGFWVQNPGTVKLTNDVLFLMDLAAKENDDDQAKIGTKRGEVLMAVGDTDRARAAYIDVLAESPYPPAAELLLFSYTRAMKKEIDAICRAVNETFEWGDAKYEFMQTCINWNGAESPEQGLTWADPNDAKWFLTRRSQQDVIRQQLEAEHKAKRALSGWGTELKRTLGLPTD